MGGEPNERMAIVETQMINIGKEVTEIKTMLITHMEADADKMTRSEAYKAFAYKQIEPEVGRLRALVVKSLWWVVGIGGTLISGLVLFFVKKGL